MRVFKTKRKAFTLLEVLITMVIIGFIGALVMALQASSWRTTTKANRTLIACHLIERQIEMFHMDSGFPAVGSLGSLTGNGIKVTWQAFKTDVSADTNTRKIILLAALNTSDSRNNVKVMTYISRDF